MNKKIICYLIVSMFLITVFSSVLFSAGNTNFDFEKANEEKILFDTINSNFNPDYVPNELIVKFTDDINNILASSKAVNNLNNKYQLKSIENIFNDKESELNNVYLLKFKDNFNMEQIAKIYSKNPYVVYAEPNYINYAFINPNDPGYEEQWHLDAINAPQAWNRLNNYGSSDVTIAILDSGIDYTHPDLGNNNEIFEQEYYFESPHPTLEYYSVVLDDFPNVPSGCSKVSLHFSTIDLKPDSNIYFYDQNQDPGFIGGVIGRFHDDGLVTDLWTSFTEISKFKKPSIRIDVRESGFDNEDEIVECWGFIIDGVRYLDVDSPEEVSNKFKNSKDFVNGDSDPIDDIGHGTHCAGVAAGQTNNNIGIAGVAGGCKLMPVEVLGETTDIGDYYEPFDYFFLNSIIALTQTNYRITQGINHAIDNGANIISMSFGCIRGELMEDAFEKAENNGVVCIAAAGNSNESEELYGFNSIQRTVLAIAATDQNDNKAEFSNYGSWIDLAAPGVDIYSTTPTYNFVFSEEYFPLDFYYSKASGTSCSCPIVAGVAALVFSKNPSLEPVEVRTILRSSVDSVNSDKYIGTGRINADIAVKKTAKVAAEIFKELDDKILHKQISIKGIAYANNFKNYKVQYAQGIYPDENEWVTIVTSDEQKTKIDDNLASFNSEKVEDGYVTIRLVVETKSGEQYFDYAVFKVSNSNMITKPTYAYYVNNRKIRPSDETVVINGIDVEVDAPNCDKVEFYLDDYLVYTDQTKPFSWFWNDVGCVGKYNLNVNGYKNNEEIESDEILVTYIHFGGDSISLTCKKRLNGQTTFKASIPDAIDLSETIPDISYSFTFDFGDGENVTIESDKPTAQTSHIYKSKGSFVVSVEGSIIIDEFKTSASIETIIENNAKLRLINNLFISKLLNKLTMLQRFLNL